MTRSVASLLMLLLIVGQWFMSAGCVLTGERETPETTKSPADKPLPHYQQAALDKLRHINGDFHFGLIDSTRYHESDSFKIFRPYAMDPRSCITRTIHNGFYTYLFWTWHRHIAVGTDALTQYSLYLEDSTPVVGFDSDSLFDVNGDQEPDLLVRANSMNGHCQAQFGSLFLYAGDVTGEFFEMEEVRNLYNPVFDPKARTITGSWQCKMIEDSYKLKWVNTFSLDTIYLKTDTLKQ